MLCNPFEWDSGAGVSPYFTNFWSYAPWFSIIVDCDFLQELPWRHGAASSCVYHAEPYVELWRNTGRMHGYGVGL